MALKHTLDLDACFLHISRGTIQAHGEEKTSILAQFDAIPHQRKFPGRIKISRPFQPADMFQDMTIHQRVETDGRQIVIIDPKILIGNEMLSVPESYATGSLGHIFVLV